MPPSSAGTRRRGRASPASSTSRTRRSVPSSARTWIGSRPNLTALLTSSVTATRAFSRTWTGRAGNRATSARRAACGAVDSWHSWIDQDPDSCEGMTPPVPREVASSHLYVWPGRDLERAHARHDLLLEGAEEALL